MSVLLNGNFLGINYLSNFQVKPSKRVYSKINIHGNAIVDKFIVKDYEMTNEELLTINLLDTLEWDKNTIAMCEFNNLRTGILSNLVNPITGWGISRKEVDGSVLKSLKIVDAYTTTFTDLTAQSNKNYIYDIFPITSNEIGNALETEMVYTDFWGVYLIDEDSGTIFKFDIDLEVGNITNETDYTEFKTYTKYSSFYFGDRDYIKGNIKCTGGIIDVDGTYVAGYKYIDDVKVIINNKKSKILKFRDGKIIRCNTMNFQYQYMNDIEEQPFTMSFDFVECGDV